tara:strand:- start:103 stop:675 length:573 start_codon:yes stop_codon:yes gene_type:complete
MINAELGHVKTLEEFYKEIRSQQEEAHGKDYCQQHDALQRLLKSGECKTYKELGTHQGGTAAAAMLCNPQAIELVDSDISRYNKFLKPLAEKYCKENNIKLTVLNTDSSGLGSLGLTCDLLLIDSYHRAFHMQKELDMHHNNVRKYIIAHDTHSVPELFHCLNNFGQQHGWEVVEQGKTNVGYTVLKKKG